MKKKIITIIAVIALVATLGICLVACNTQSYEKKLKKAGYEVDVMEKGELGNSSEYDELTWLVSAYKESSDDYVTVMKFAKTADAKKMEKEIKNKSSDDGQDYYVVYRTGSILIVGTKQGVKDAK